MKNRSGSYKKVLFDSLILQRELPFLQLNVKKLEEAKLSPPELCTLYMLLFLRLRHPKNWLQRKKKIFRATNNDGFILDAVPESFGLTDWEKEKLQGVSFSSLFSHFNLKGVPLSINRTMLKWISGEWDIILLTRIPAPRELLKMQVNKARCLTVIVEPEKLDQLVLSARDPLSFVFHDLMHADHFFNHESIIKGQLGFYHCVDTIYDQKAIKHRMREDKIFKKEFDYVASDMNAYVVHLAKCFKSAIVKADPELYLCILDWWNMPSAAYASALKLNTPAFTAQDEKNLVNFFESRAQ